MTIKQSSTTHRFDLRFIPGQPDRYSYVDFKRRREGSELKNHSVLIRDGENATTPLIANEQVLSTYIGTKIVGTYGVNEIPFTSYGDGLNFNVASTHKPEMASLLVDAKAQCLGKAFNKIREKQTLIESQILLGELKETINLLRNPLGQSLKLAKALDASVKQALKGKGNLKADLKVIKQISGSYLEFQFGVVPLIHDSIAIMELARAIQERKNVMTYRFYSDRKSSSSESTTFDAVNGGFVLQIETTTTSQAQYIVRYGIVEKLLSDMSGSLTVLQSNLLDATLLPSTLWELTHLSWLFDYFVNVDDIITAATTSTSILGWQSSSAIRESTKSQSVWACAVSGTGNKVTSFTPGLLVTKFRDVERDGAVLGIPPLSFTLPGSNTKYLNIAAFLAGKII